VHVKNIEKNDPLLVMRMNDDVDGQARVSEMKIECCDEVDHDEAMQ